MGTQITPLLITKEISIDDLKNRKLAVDAYNQLYQYLSTIRQSDGSLLMDSKGEVTSHLSGLFFKTVNLMEKGVQLAFVFDGRPPELKAEEIERRREMKRKAEELFEKAEGEHDIGLMSKYAKRTSKLTKDMVDEAKELLDGFGIPYIQAPSEGEAQAAYMVKKGDFYGLISQDADGLLFGATRLVKNLTISQKRKLANSPAYQKISPEVIDLAENMNALGIDQDQLIVLGMLVGTDFNIGGIKGIGPKNGLKLLKQHGRDFDSLFLQARWDEHFKHPWREVFDTIKNIPVTEDFEIRWKPVDKDRIKRLMVGKHEFSEERIDSALAKIGTKNAQKGLSDFF